MVKYHINERTGNANICRASKNPCPLGPTAPHYDSKEEARAAYESSRSEELLPTAQKPSEVPSSEVVLTKSGWLRDDFAALAAPRGVACPECERPADHHEARDLIDSRAVYCLCGHDYALEEAKVEITPDNPSYRFLQDEEVFEATWYHSTSDPEWLQSIEGDENEVEIHVGTRAASFDRALTDTVSHLGGLQDKFYLYEVRIDPESKLNATVAKDENSSLLAGGDSDVVRYINRWEDMASISLAARPGRIKIQNCSTVSREEAHRMISLYNVEDDMGTTGLEEENFSSTGGLLAEIDRRLAKSRRQLEVEGPSRFGGGPEEEIALLEERRAEFLRRG